MKCRVCHKSVHRIDFAHYSGDIDHFDFDLYDEAMTAECHMQCWYHLNDFAKFLLKRKHSEKCS